MTGPGRVVPVRKGLLGGMFNPPHVAHLIVAHIVRETLGLERVVLVPTSVHAFKGEAEASARDRAVMAELAVAGDSALEVDRIEVRRGGISYTVDTLRELRDREPDTVWHLIVGQDNLAELDQWRDVERLPEMAQIVLVSRGLSAAVPAAEPPFGGRFTRVPVPALEISSTAVRQRVAGGRSIRYWVPPAVEAYIAERGLYGGRSTEEVGSPGAPAGR
ncbi:MAG TPA: nicotinate-nucleotide adenylyltransferase [Gemmatimonadota bacterium]|nr:nicotinate-nucleotide adenylyltransferase [Gemmatimonadota bacterium]